LEYRPVTQAKIVADFLTRIGLSRFCLIYQTKGYPKLIIADGLSDDNPHVPSLALPVVPQ